MTTLRLIADDLTGALDSAAAFAPAFGPLRVAWRAGGPADVVNSGTREMGGPAAARRLAGLAAMLQPQAGRISVFKVDSLLRGHAGRELLAVLAQVSFDHVVIAPAIPFQGRATRMGRQMARFDGNWTEVGEDIAATLAAGGHGVRLCRAGEPLPQGISLWDAETSEDLRAIVAAGVAAAGTVLWVGAAGLAAALAGSLAGRVDRAPLPEGPLLGLIGSDHAVMAAQLAPCAAERIEIGPDAALAAEGARARLAGVNVCLVTPHLGGGLARADAAAAIAARFAAVLDLMDRPGALFVSGGETLSAVADALGAEALEVFGEFEPGIPMSRLSGGRWDGLAVISKSGAFGAPDTLSRLVSCFRTNSKDGVS